jgi:hypothetical protein
LNTRRLLASSGPISQTWGRLDGVSGMEELPIKRNASACRTSPGEVSFAPIVNTICPSAAMFCHSSQLERLPSRGSSMFRSYQGGGSSFLNPTSRILEPSLSFSHTSFSPRHLSVSNTLVPLQKHCCFICANSRQHDRSHRRRRCPLQTQQR